jgi:ADP-Ribosyltransferase in polyvalent proteins
MESDLRQWLRILEDLEPDHAYGIEAYHGTGADFPAFQIGHRGSNSRESNIGYWFTNSPAAASDFADFAARGSGANVIPVRLRMNHPFVAISYDEIRDLVDKFTTFARPGYEMPVHSTHYGGVYQRQIRMTRDKVDYDALRAWMKSQGYDGIILRNTLVDSPDGKTRTDQYVVFDANQIRSRFAKFDPTKADSDIITDAVET